MYNDEIYHYGVKGMKWGVRRYKNYNGSYTQKGVKRFEKSSDAYDAGKNLYKTLKKNKKQKGNSFSVEVQDKQGQKATLNVKDANSAMKSVKNQTKLAKQQMKKDYKHLKYDKLADQGKELYSQGYRITDNAGTKLAGVGSSGLVATGWLYTNNLVTKNQATTLASIAAATTAVGTGMKYVNYNKDRKLRAFYGHTSNY